jgi:hypothetical protein
VLGLVGSNDPGSKAGGSINTGRVKIPEKSKGMVQTKKLHPSPPGWWLGVGVGPKNPGKIEFGKTQRQLGRV